MTLNDRHVDLEGKSGDTLLDCFVFAGDDRMIRHVWSAGRHMVRDGRHTHREEIEENYRRTMRELGDII